MANDLLSKDIKMFIDTKPEVLDIIGYGSAVKTQTNDNEKIKKQIDIIATCDNATSWHKENLKTSKKEYNPFAKIFINDSVQHFGTDIQYLSNIEYNEHLFKLGIISKEDLIKDLLEWKNFYMAGRFHKPVLVVEGDKELERAIEIDRLNALRVSLLLQKDNKFTESDLFKTICFLSYYGDIRFDFNLENPHKINNIVNGEFKEFKHIYKSNELYALDNNIIIPNKEELFKEIQDLPIHLLDYLIQNGISLNDYTVENLDKITFYILNFLKINNKKSSICQPLKSISINSFKNSKIYLKEKRKKYLLNK